MLPKPTQAFCQKHLSRFMGSWLPPHPLSGQLNVWGQIFEESENFSLQAAEQRWSPRRCCEHLLALYLPKPAQRCRGFFRSSPAGSIPSWLWGLGAVSVIVLPLSVIISDLPTFFWDTQNCVGLWPWRRCCRPHSHTEPSDYFRVEFSFLSTEATSFLLGSKTYQCFWEIMLATQRPHRSQLSLFVITCC